MIRVLQRKLIIPRGDTGTLTLPAIAAATAGDVAVFTIFDEVTKTRLFQKQVAAENDKITIAFTHNDTVNLKPGKYLWDIKFYRSPVFSEGELIDGEEIDSYYAGYTTPICEIRETGDNFLTSPEGAELTPAQLDILSSALASIQTIAADAAAAIEKLNNLNFRVIELPADDTAGFTKNIDPDTGAITYILGLPRKDWIGTEEEYNSLEEIDPNTIYYIRRPQDD